MRGEGGESGEYNPQHYGPVAANGGGYVPRPAGEDGIEPLFLIYILPIFWNYMNSYHSFSQFVILNLLPNGLFDIVLALSPCIGLTPLQPHRRRILPPKARDIT